MNDRCAAGTGRFIENTAKALELSLEEFSSRSLSSHSPAATSSMCTVFAESEVISPIAQGASIEDVSAGVHASVARRIRVMAKKYLDINCACFTPNNERLEDVVRLAMEYRADGVVYYALQFCHEFNTEFVKVERALKDTGIPVIKIETDYSDSDKGQLKTRIETFVEMLRASKASKRSREQKVP